MRLRRFKYTDIYHIFALNVRKSFLILGYCMSLEGTVDNILVVLNQKRQYFESTIPNDFTRESTILAFVMVHLTTFIDDYPL